MHPRERPPEGGCRIRVEVVGVIELDDPRVNAMRDRTHDGAEALMPSERLFLDLARNSLATVRQDGDAFVADTALPPSAWSPAFLHGADTLLPIGQLLTRLLKKGEFVDRIEQLRWNRVMTHQLRLRVSPSGIPATCGTKTALRGNFHTNKGRTLTLSGDLTDTPIDPTQMVETNPLSDRFCLCPECMEQYMQPSASGIYTLATQPLEHDGKNTLATCTHPGLLMGSTLDTVNTALSLLRRGGLSIGATDYALIGGISGFTPPHRRDFVNRGSLALKIHTDRRLATSSGFDIFPVSAEMRNQHGAVVSNGRCDVAVAQSEDAYRQYHAKIGTVRN